LAEHHRNKLAPAAEAFGRFFCTALLFVSSFLERFLDRSAFGNTPVQNKDLKKMLLDSIRQNLGKQSRTDSAQLAVYFIADLGKTASEAVWEGFFTRRCRLFDPGQVSMPRFLSWTAWATLIS
jgi:hypothetical protein